MKKLIVRLILSALISVSFSSPALAKPKAKQTVENKRSKVVRNLEKAILGFNPKLTKSYAKKLAEITEQNARKYDLDPALLVSILNTESSFNQRAISSTNDISIAQINLSVWTPDYFKKTTGQPLSLKKLRSDESYAISRMCLILNHYKKRFFLKDKKWFARYHSGTPKFKDLYFVRVETSLNRLNLIADNI